MKSYKKKLIILIVIVLTLIGYMIYSKLSFESALNNTIKYYEKINYTTNIKLKISNKNISSTINYNCSKSNNIKQIMIENEENNILSNKIYKYEVIEDNKKITYLYDGEKYKIEKNDSQDFSINYKKLKKNILLTKSKFGNVYIVKMKAKDAYNFIYDKEILTTKDIDKNINVTITVDNKYNFIKSISYDIDNINKNKLKYKVRIKNSDINNHNVIKLPNID